MSRCLVNRCGRAVLPLLSVVVAGGCIAIDDYSKFSFDGGPGTIDARVDAAGDADGGSSDTGTPATCDPPCLTDSYIDFSTDQGTEPLTWRYQAQPFADHLDYFDLVPGNHRDVDGWVASPAPPAILPCHEPSDLCVATSELVLEAGADTGPVLLTTVPTTGRYAIDVSTRAIGSAPTELWVSRNSAADLVGYAAIDPSGGRGSISVQMEAVEGDRIVIALRNPTGASDAIVGVNVRVSNSATPSTCEHVATFDGDRSDACGGPAYEADGPGTLPALSTGPAAYLGTAQELTSGSGTGVGLIASDATIDRSGDFTTQLWAFIDSQDYVTSSIYQDWDGTASSGINFSMEEPSGADEIEMWFLYRDETNTEFPGVTCVAGDCSGVLRFARPPDDTWVHLRLTRSTADDTVRACVDGVEVAGTEILPGADVSNPLSPKVGFNFSGTPTFRIDGTVDDIRQFSEALPCAPPRP
jgi:hypothetical protein